MPSLRLLILQNFISILLISTIIFVSKRQIFITVLLPILIFFFKYFIFYILPLFILFCLIIATIAQLFNQFLRNVHYELAEQGVRVRIE